MGIFGAFKGKREDEAKRRAAQYVTEGQNYNEKGRFMEGIVELQKAISIDPSCIDAYYSIAYSHHGLARIENQKAGGNIYFSAGLENLNKAITALEKVVHLQPNAADAFLSLGTAYDNACRFDDAERCYREAIRLDPKGIDGADGYHNLALLIYMRAIGWLGLKQFPKQFMLNINEWLANENRKQAFALAEKAIEICEPLAQRQPQHRPNLIQYHRQLAGWFDRAMQGSSAILHYQAVLRLDPNDTEVRAWLQQAEKNTGKKLL